MFSHFFSNKKRVILLSLILGVFVMSLKFWAAFITRSNAILTDAAESIVNILASAFALYSLYLSEKPKDFNHPYGHGKIEFFSSGVEGFLILLAGLLTLIPTLGKLVYSDVEIRSINVGIGLTTITMILNGGLGWFLRRKGRELRNIVLEADGKHLLLDSLSSLVLIFGLFLVKITGNEIIDPILSIFFGVYLVYNGWRLLRISAGALMDEADFELVGTIIEVLKINRKTLWIDIHNLRIQKYGTNLHLDCHITLPFYLSLKDSHYRVREFENVVKSIYPDCMEVFVHTDPCLPDCCSYCKVVDCMFRTEAYSHEVVWNHKTIITDKKHFEY